MSATDWATAFTPPRRRLAWLVILGIAQTVALLGSVLLVRWSIDHLVAFPGQVHTTLLLAGGLAVIVLIQALLRALEFTYAERLGFELVRDLRMTMYRHLAGMSPRQLQHRSRGALLLRFTGDLTMFRTWISRGLARAIVSGMTITGSICFLLWLSPLLGLTLASLLLAGSAISLAMGRRLRKLTRWVRRRRSLLTSNVEEQLRALHTVQVFGRSGGETMRLSRQNDSLTGTLVREAKLRGALRGVANGSGRLTAAAVLLVGGLEVGAGQLTIGGLVAALILIPQLGATVRTLGLAHDYWQRAQVSRVKVTDFLNSSSRRLDEPDKPPLRVRKGHIELVDATIHGAIEGIDLAIAPAELVVVTGPTGAGKSTLLATIARLSELDRGKVLIDGQDVSEHRLSSIYRQVSMVSPDLPLMRGTIRRNLTYRNRSATREEVSRLVMAWQLDELFADSAAGLDSWVVEEGRNLSTGQRQRLALARAMLDNPRILLLDEPANGLDTASADLMRRVLARHQGTVVMVSHDPGDWAIADRVIQLRNGRLVASEPGHARNPALDDLPAKPAWAGNHQR